MQERKGTAEGQCSGCMSLQHQGACPLSRTVGRQRGWSSLNPRKAGAEGLPSSGSVFSGTCVVRWGMGVGQTGAGIRG